MTPQRPSGHLAWSDCATYRGRRQNIVPKQDLTAAISAQQGAGSVGSAIAPPLGGLLFGAFRGLPFLADAISSWSRGSRMIDAVISGKNDLD